MRKVTLEVATVSSNGFMKGMAIGMLTGAAIGVGVIAMPKNKNGKRSTGRFLKVAGEIMENISEIWA